MVLPTELLQEAMAGARGGGGDRALATLQSAITTAEGAEGVEEVVIQEAKTLLATQPLHAAIARREVAGLAAAIEAADGVADVDPAVVEVSGEGDCERRGWCDG